MTTITSFLLNREQFQAYRTTFKQKANNRSLTQCDMLLHNMLRGLPLDRGFTPITNANKLANGATPNYAFEHAKSTLKWFIKRQPQGYYKSTLELLSPEQIEQLLEML